MRETGESRLDKSHEPNECHLVEPTIMFANFSELSASREGSIDSARNTTVSAHSKSNVEERPKPNPEEKIHVIPFPCHPVTKGNKAEARLKLALPLNWKILLIFGQHVEKDLELLQSISTLGIRYPILLLVVSIHAPNRMVASNIQVDIRNEAPNIGRLYDYLHASDALILNRQVETKAVVSSTAHQCLGSGCPIICLLYTSPSPRDGLLSRMPSSA